MTTEYWLRGPVPGVPPILQPAAHALLQARMDVTAATRGLDTSHLWISPGGAASIGFHLNHLAGSIDRLLTYARGETLSAAQLAYLASETEPGEPPADADALMARVDAAVDHALDQICATDERILLEPRTVGRQRLGSTVLGLLFHAAEHAARHAGQVITTAKVIRAV